MIQNADRETIFTHIAKARGSKPWAKASIQIEADNLLMMSADTRDHLQADDLVEAFEKRIATGLVIGTSCERIATTNDISTATARYMAQHDLGSQLAVQPHPYFEALHWNGLDVDGNVIEEGAVSISLADYAIAETGSVVIHSSNTMPILHNFLCLHHIIVVKRSTVLAFLDDYALLANSEARKGEVPRNSCLITGASGTTDIEGVLVRGAHGPESVHIIVVDLE